MVFCRANAREIHAVSRILDKFEEWLGKRVNKEKSALFCSRNTHLGVCENLCNIMRVKNLPLNSKYLGLPMVIGRSKNKAFIDVKNKVMAKVAGWNMRSLSQAGRTTLIKVVATAMPLYNMSTFLLPKGWCEENDRLLKDFWWGFPAQKKFNFTQICRRMWEG